MKMIDPPPVHEGDPPTNPASTWIPVVETVPQPTASTGFTIHAPPFQHMPHRFNQWLQNFSDFLTPFRNTIVPLFSTPSVQPNEASWAPLPPLDPSSQVVQNDPTLPPPSGIAHAHSPPCSNHAPQQQQSSSDDLDTHDFDWSVDEEDVTYFLQFVG